MLKTRIPLLAPEILCNFEPTYGGLLKSESKKSSHHLNFSPQGFIPSCLPTSENIVEMLWKNRAPLKPY